MTDAPVPAQAGTDLGGEAVELLQRLIRFDTVNPPGNEAEAQQHLHGLLSAAGWDCELLAAEPERPNLVARLAGEADGPTLALICHVDTVPAEASEWSVDPWSGELRDDCVWGRGALDMKDQVASEAAACIELGRSGWRPAAGELLFVCTADEETGAHKGAQWICAEHPDKVRADMVVNEGAGLAVDFEGRRLYTLAVGEKGVFRFLLRTRGVAGHGSLPNVGDNALLRLAPLLGRLRQQPPRETTPDTELFLTRLLGADADDLDAALERIRAANAPLADLLAEPMLGVTLAPTMASGSEKDNMIPSSAEVLVDCRVPPEMEGREVRERIETVLGQGGPASDGSGEEPPPYDVEFVEEVVGNRSDYGGPLAEAIEAWVAETDPGAEVLPGVMPGFSDSHWFREAFGSVVYGFCPQNAMSFGEAEPLIHGADERIAVADVELMAGFFHDLPRRILG
jgi:acetylornithine deacetylase/succinyl-diaminopimelate desuccinylase-like protein